MKNNQLEQLLTQLTPQEAATVEGGATFTLLSIRAINPGVQNDPRVLFGNQELYSQNDLNPPTIVLAASSAQFFSPTLLQLYDIDPPAGLAGDDLRGEALIEAINQTSFVNLGGYRLRYRVTGA